MLIVISPPTPLLASETFYAFIPTGAMVGQISRPIVRAINRGDGEAVRHLLKTAGLSTRLVDDWPRLGEDNPAWALSVPKPCTGWILEAAGKIVGYLGNTTSLCRFENKTLVATAASGFVVDPPYRGYGLLLVAAFFKQKDVDILLNTTANEAAAKIFQRFKAVPLPQQDYNKILFWVLHPQPFVASTLMKVGLYPAPSRFFSYLLAVFLRADSALRNRKFRQKKTGWMPRKNVRVIDVSEIGSEFDALWSRKIGEENRFLSYRTAAALKWHFAGQRAKVMCCDHGGQLKGYAIVTRDGSQTLRLARSWIVDICVEDDDPQVVDQLLEAAYSHAKNDGSHVLEVMGFPKSIRDRFLELRPYSRMSPNLPYFYLAPDGDLQQELLDEDAWYACPYDGDASL